MDDSLAGCKGAGVYFQKEAPFQRRDWTHGRAAARQTDDDLRPRAHLRGHGAASARMSVDGACLGLSSGAFSRVTRDALLGSSKIGETASRLLKRARPLETELPWFVESGHGPPPSCLRVHNFETLPATPTRPLPSRHITPSCPGCLQHHGSQPGSTSSICLCRVILMRSVEASDSCSDLTT